MDFPIPFIVIIVLVIFVIGVLVCFRACKSRHATAPGSRKQQYVYSKKSEDNTDFGASAPFTDNQFQSATDYTTAHCAFTGYHHPFVDCHHFDHHTDHHHDITNDTVDACSSMPAHQDFTNDTVDACSSLPASQTDDAPSYCDASAYSDNATYSCD